METEWNKQPDNQDTVSSNPLLYQKIQLAILQDENTVAVKRLKLYAFATRVAAVLAIGLLFTGVWFFTQQNSFSDSGFLQTVSIPLGAQTQLQLPDGSSVWLNSGSTLTYSDDFSKKRQVELKGEAFFDIVKSKAPFKVNTSSGVVEGGIVNVTDNGQKQRLMLNPGEQVCLEQDKLVKNTVNTELFTSWKDGKLIFSREPFPAMIKRLERWFNIEIEHPGYDFGSLWFSGTVEGETLTEVMDMICKAAPVVYSYNSKDRKVKIEVKEERTK